ncbi:hypothetical protein MBAV_005993 [Candidatus Magnetobacterium bavaricum]|uniref:Uncharacterized protein n=1 Tax=Candidatus Magnetobacterium bavaricum TaxID=29290 RepID=A0A0F3GIP2_9BACT|nr:hypothetical protein MBAV_005993 [Candidatus Magnetobacterium bavaricum]
MITIDIVVSLLFHDSIKAAVIVWGGTLVIFHPTIKHIREIVQEDSKMEIFTTIMKHLPPDEAMEYFKKLYHDDK